MIKVGDTVKVINNDGKPWLTLGSTHKVIRANRTHVTIEVFDPGYSRTMARPFMISRFEKVCKYNRNLPNWF